ncbi:hypothetical protein HOY82DRAFT_651188 [Tuber indicum]|nr:hypothetical protein HOY82DRAFT_651188 [Tuber indicum]
MSGGKQATADAEKDLSLMFNHMSAVVNSTIYTIGGTVAYWVPNSTPSSIVSDNNNSVHILRGVSEFSSHPPQSLDSFLRALDLSKPVDFEAEFSDTSQVISMLPFTVPVVSRGAAWADQNTIYYWGGEMAESTNLEQVLLNGTSEWPDPTKYYTYDLSQLRPNGTWKTVSISEAEGSDTLTSSPSYGESTYAAEARKGFYFGGVMARRGLKNKDGSNATTGAIGNPNSVNSMVVFDSATKVWKNETVIAELNNLQDGAMVYVGGVGEKGMLVRMGGVRKGKFVGAPLIPSHSYRKSHVVSFDTVYLYDIAARVWYRQPTTSKTHTFPESRAGGFCAGAVAAPDKTSFTIYVYGGYDRNNSYVKGMWALTMPYFQWFPVGSTGEPERGRSGTTCHTIGGKLVMVRGKGDQENRGDTNGGSYFYDMTDLTWSLKYKPSDYQVPKTIYDVIGGNGQGGATRTSPIDDKNFPSGPGKLFVAGRTNSPKGGGGGRRSTGGGSFSLIGAIVGGVLGGIAVLVTIGVGIRRFSQNRRTRRGMREKQGTLVQHRESSDTGASRNWSTSDGGGFAQLE